MPYPQTGTNFYTPDGKNRTGTALSTNIIIKVGNNPVGAIQNIQISESRGIRMIDEVGTDGHIDSAPNSSTNISGSCDRIRFDRLRILEAFGRGFIHLHAQRRPFNIDIIDTWNGDGSSSIITTVRNVWIKDMSYTYAQNDFIISERMSFEAEAIYSVIAGTNNNVANNNDRSQLSLDIDPIERQADIGNRRGSLDAPGLFNVFGFPDE